MDGLVEYLENKLEKKLNESHVRMLHPLVLAYIGDTVYDLFVRTYLTMLYEVSVHQLHIKAVGLVRAGAQAVTLHQIEEFLTDEEYEIVKRGRNAKSGTIPKSADMMEYKWATGFESLLGYLYLLGRKERLLEILDHILMEQIGNDKK
jgi:ribonuclease-3 family protein